MASFATVSKVSSLGWSRIWAKLIYGSMFLNVVFILGVSAILCIRVARSRTKIIDEAGKTLNTRTLLDNGRFVVMTSDFVKDSLIFHAKTISGDCFFSVDPKMFLLEFGGLRVVFIKGEALSKEESSRGWPVKLMIKRIENTYPDLYQQTPEGVFVHLRQELKQSASKVL